LDACSGSARLPLHSEQIPAAIHAELRFMLRAARGQRNYEIAQSD
jgi:hypothetical protein